MKGVRKVFGIVLAFCIIIAGSLFTADAPAAAAEGAPAEAAEPVSPHTFSGTFTILTDYVWRGLSRLTWGKQAIQGSLSYAHASGFYLGIWGGNISSNIYPNVQLEMDYYAGYGGAITEDLTYDVGANAYTYPGANYNRIPPLGSLPDKHFDTVELYAGLTYKWFGVKYWYAVTDFLGYSAETTPIGAFAGNPQAGVESGGTQGSGYLEANANFGLPWDLTLGLHVGHEFVRNGTKLDWTDYKVGLIKDLGKGWNAGLAFTAASEADEYSDYPSLAGQETTRDLNKSQIVFSVGKSF